MSRARLIIGTILAVAFGAVAVIAVITRARAETVPASQITIIDGDTVKLACSLPDCTKPERIRILNIDAPEIDHARCDAEREMGIEARDELRLLLTGQIVTIDRCEPSTGRCRDPYGRTLALLAIPAGDVGKLLIARGRALPWVPGRAAKEQRAKVFCGG